MEDFFYFSGGHKREGGGGARCAGGGGERSHSKFGAFYSRDIMAVDDIRRRWREEWYCKRRPIVLRHRRRRWEASLVVRISPKERPNKGVKYVKIFATQMCKKLFHWFPIYWIFLGIGKSWGTFSAKARNIEEDREGERERGRGESCLESQ